MKCFLIGFQVQLTFYINLFERRSMEHTLLYLFLAGRIIKLFYSSWKTRLQSGAFKNVIFQLFIILLARRYLVATYLSYSDQLKQIIYSFKLLIFLLSKADLKYSISNETLAIIMQLLFQIVHRKLSQLVCMCQFCPSSKF